MDYRKKGDRERVAVDGFGPGRTKQSFKNQCDINFILRGYRKTGVVPQNVDGEFLDVPGGLDYQAMLNYVMAANAAFAGMPAELRKRFDNNPQKLLEFVGDASNREEAITLGLIDPPEEPVEAPTAPAVEAEHS